MIHGLLTALTEGCYFEKIVYILNIYHVFYAFVARGVV
jgi:hypothetical protein